MTEAKPLSRSEREAKIKDKAGFVISVFALLLAFNTYIGNGLSGTILTNTIKANDTWSFYQAKSIKQTIVDNAADDADVRGDKEKGDKYRATSKRYESDPTTGEGKKELMEKATTLEAERDLAKKKSPWISFAGSAMQMAIVLVSASIVAVSAAMFWASFGVMAVGLTLMSQGIWLWF
jgi:ABC-type multidrug transport system fused ATPase/permease subunit